ncbi:GCG_CRPN prefix-to-repeats domain-containing protein [Methylobacterium sp. E-046]|uniref:GCG_CRPN prefix-to-repeats domain-containing protein n=1 Tax=Methylobacterium sp. E-046 TaxID=2836576 RepID=UPI00391A93E0
MKIMNTLIAAGALAALPVVSANAMPIVSNLGVTAPIALVAGGCGPGAWRGPWGHCRNTPYVGRLPGGWYQVRAGNGCPPGYWRGPWGHCRNTPFHGRLPGGGFR